MGANRAIAGGLSAVAALALVASALAPAGAATQTTSQDVPGAHRRLSGKSGISLPSSSGIGSFTPAAADPRRAALQGLVGLSGSGFRFTPSAAPGSRRAVTVAVRARATSMRGGEPLHNGIITNLALAPSAYNLGVSIGWKRFALSGDYAKVEGNLLPTDTEAMDVGVSYTNRKWSTRLQFGADRSIGQHPALLGIDQSYSLDLGGSYALTRNLDLAGGVRYKSQRDRNDIADERRDGQAVYVGTAFRF